MKNIDVVEPAVEKDLHSSCAELLCQSGIPEKDALWIADIISDVEFSFWGKENSDDDKIAEFKNRILKYIIKYYTKYPDNPKANEVAVLLYLSRYHLGMPEGPSAIRNFYGKMDFSVPKKLKERFEKDVPEKIARFMKEIAIDEEKKWDIGYYLSWFCHFYKKFDSPWNFLPHPQEILDISELVKEEFKPDLKDKENPRSFLFWLYRIPSFTKNNEWYQFDGYQFSDEYPQPAALDWYFQRIDHANDEESKRYSFTLEKILAHPFFVESTYLKDLALPLEKYFDFLYKKSQEKPEDTEFLELVWRFARLTYVHEEDSVHFPMPDFPEDTIKELVVGAKERLGKLRPLLRGKNADKELSRHGEPFFTTATRFFVDFDSSWNTLKTFLLLFRSLQTPAVTSDLRGWKIRGESELPPEPYSIIPRCILRVFNLISNERKDDPKLESIRKEFASFCLSKLKTKKEKQGDHPPQNEDFVEESPIWRYFYIRALRDLKINPKGKGHHVLRWVSRNDPQEEVRSMANIAYKELRHQVALPPNISSRKPLFAAFWWLRQAHLLELGVKIDDRGAQRTRSKEVTRTT